MALLFGCASAYCQARPVSVPFVGCPSVGQTEGRDAPNGTSESVPITEQDAQALAYYKSGDGIGVLAPRGWHCQGVSGSSGAVLYVAPKPIDPNFVSESLEAAAIEVYDINGEASGRYEIAELIAWLFPAYRKLASELWERDLDAPFPSGPYPKDTLTGKSDTVVEYRTPARKDGLGNFNSRLGKNDLPIVGAAILLIDSLHPEIGPSHLLLLSIRVTPDLAPLTPTIIQHFERAASR